MQRRHWGWYACILLTYDHQCEPTIPALQARAPQITTFRIPFSIWTTTTAMAGLAYVTFSPEPHAPNFHPAFLLAHSVRTALPDWALAASWGMIAVLHPLEAVYALVLAARHRMPFTIGVSHRCKFLMLAVADATSYVAVLRAWYACLGVPNT